MPSRPALLVVLFLLTCALPAFGNGVGSDASAVRGEDPATPFPTAADPLTVDPVEGAPMVDAKNVPTANRTWRESQRPLSPESPGLMRFTQRLGDARVLGSALLAGYVTGRISRLPDLSAASARVAGATFSAAVLCAGLRSVAGRVRPEQVPGEPGSFGWHDAAFPSGQTTIAFAAASAIAAESQARWVRWVVYPAAAAAGLAQVHENGAGLGNVAAGAALGFWTGRKVDQIERGRVRIFDRAHFLASGSPRSFRVGFKARF